MFSRASSHIQNERFQLGVVLFLIFATQAIAVYLGARFELTDQEAYYWTWSQHLDWGYFDHPPLHAWISAFFESLFGDAPWVVRLPAFLGRSIAFSLFVWSVAKRHSVGQATLAALIALSSPVLTLGSIISVPDVVAVPLGLAALIMAEQNKAFLSGILWGLGILAKWSIIFIAPGLLYILLETQRGGERPWAKFFLPALILQAPMLYWNFQHHWATFIFQFFARHHHEILPFDIYVKNFEHLLGSQVFAFGIVITGLFIWGLWKGSLKKQKLFLLIVLPSIAFMAASGMQGQLRYYWACFVVFPVSFWISAQAVRLSEATQRSLRLALVGCVGLTWALLLVAVTEPVGPYLDFLTHRQPSNFRHSPQGDVRGWKDWVSYLQSERSVDLSQTVFYATDFHIAGQVEWALGRAYMDQVGTLAPFERRNQFQMWSLPEPRKVAVFVGDDRYDNFASLERACEERVQWNDFKIKLRGFTIKDIRWAFCQKPLIGNFLNHGG